MRWQTRGHIGPHGLDGQRLDPALDESQACSPLSARSDPRSGPRGGRRRHRSKSRAGHGRGRPAPSRRPAEGRQERVDDRRGPRSAATGRAAAAQASGPDGGGQVAERPAAGTARPRDTGRRPPGPRRRSPPSERTTAPRQAVAQSGPAARPTQSWPIDSATIAERAEFARASASGEKPVSRRRQRQGRDGRGPCPARPAPASERASPGRPRAPGAGRLPRPEEAPRLVAGRARRCAAQAAGNAAEAALDHHEAHLARRWTRRASA